MQCDTKHDEAGLLHSRIQNVSPRPRQFSVFQNKRGAGLKKRFLKGRLWLWRCLRPGECGECDEDDDERSSQRHAVSLRKILFKGSSNATGLVLPSPLVYEPKGRSLYPYVSPVLACGATATLVLRLVLSKRLHQEKLMSEAKRHGFSVVLCVLAFFFVLFGIVPVHAQSLVRGVNFVHPLQFSPADQDASLAHLKSAGVRVIRLGIEEDLDKNLDFMKRAYAQNIATVLILHGRYAPNAPRRSYLAKEYPGMWAGPPLSSLDPELSRQYFQQVIDKLDAEGIVLAGLELENEINMAGNNPDFRLPGESKVLSLNDLYHDPEGQQVAKGYLQYLKELAALKQVRDRSKLNKHTPLLPTSLVEIVQEGPWPTPKKYDGVSVGATLAFFRANGLDKLVDAYNLHTYPWADGPGNNVSATHRLRRLQALVQPVCSPAGSSSGKPCWITEWGFTNDSKSCPSDEKSRSVLVQEMMGDFRQFTQERRLTGVIYYSWIGDQPFDVYRCGGLTESGRLAITPM